MKRVKTAMDSAILRLIEEGTAFVLFQNQEEPTHLFIQRCGTVTQLSSLQELHEQHGFLFSPFHPTKQHPILLLTPETRIESREKIKAYLKEISSKDQNYNSRHLITNNQTDIGPLKEEYNKLFMEFSRNLKLETFGKLVLSRQIEFCPPSDKILPFTLFENACVLYPNAYKYLFFSPESGLWLGCSPELMLHKTGDRYTTQSLAGTMLYDQSMTISNWSKSMCIEQELVTDYFCSQLEALDLNYHCEDQKIVTAGELAHLSTKISFYNQRHSLGELLHHLYPTPAICGLPKDDAKRFILQHEKNHRTYYSGILGYIAPEGECNLFVNLRCFSLKNNFIKIYAGSGLLADSQLEEQWQETENKLQTMQKLFFYHVS